jgi:hypothetical protein
MYGPSKKAAAHLQSPTKCILVHARVSDNQRRKTTEKTYTVKTQLQIDSNNNNKQTTRNKHKRFFQDQPHENDRNDGKMMGITASSAKDQKQAGPKRQGNK